MVDGATGIELKRNSRVLGTGAVIGEDATRDVALVRSSAPLRGPTLQLASRSPRLGESVAALGFPLGLPLTVTQGTVSGLQRTIPIGGIERRDLVQTDAALNHGNSGGPLIAIDTGDVVGLVDLGFSGSNGISGISFAVSAQVARPLPQVWEASPQPTPAATCTPTTTTPTTTTAATTSAATTSAATTTPSTAVPSYNGTAFSVEYPPGWVIESAEQPHSYGTDTTIASPSAPSTTLVRIDVSANAPHISLRALAQTEITALSREPGYSLIALTGGSVDGFPALRWEFVVDENGILLQKEDDFFVDSSSNDDAVAILTEAPASDYSAYASAFAAIRQTAAMN